MKILVVGCGKVGHTLVKQLSEEGHDITVIDENAERLDRITSTLDVMGVVGNGVSFQTLNRADIMNADLLISVTNSDEHNLLCCLIGKKAGNCKTIALVRNPIYNDEINYLKDEFGLAMVVNPELAAAAEISRIFRFPFASKIDTFAKGKVDLIHFRVKKNSMLAGCTLQEVNDKLKSELLVCMVIRKSEVVIPNGDFRLEENDLIAVVTDVSKANNIFRKIGVDMNRINHVMLLGGGTVAYYLAKRLLPSGIHVKIIEIDKGRCEQLSELLPKATIICGDATDQELLIQEGIETVDGVAALTGLDEENIFLSLFAQGNSDAKSVTRVNRVTFTNIIDKIELDSIIYPHFIASDYIVKCARSLSISSSLNSNVETLYILADGKAEAVEFFVHENSRVIGIPLEVLKIKKNILICCINRNGRIIVPSGQDMIQEGDTVVVVLKEYRLKDISEILED